MEVRFLFNGHHAPRCQHALSRVSAVLSSHLVQASITAIPTAAVGGHNPSTVSVGGARGRLFALSGPVQAQPAAGSLQHRGRRQRGAHRRGGEAAREQGRQSREFCLLAVCDPFVTWGVDNQQFAFGRVPIGASE